MRPDAAVLPAAVALGRALRAAGLTAVVDQQVVFARALGEIDVRSREQVFWAAHAAFVHDPGERARFAAVFDAFWAGGPLDRPAVVAEHTGSDPRMPGPQHGGEALPQFRTEGRSAPLVDGTPTRATREVPSAGEDERDGTGVRRGVLAAYSPADVAPERRPVRPERSELAAMLRLAEELRAAVPERRSRRAARSDRGGRLDVRRTLARALATDGEPLRPAYTVASTAPRRLVLLCDVSGSMDRVSRALLTALGGVVASGSRREAFVFATRLTRLTGPLSARDAAAALERARAAVDDWSGGTRIGAALAEFNARHAPRGLARGAIVVIVSDGWDRGDPGVLARELDRLRLQARRLVWVNPRPAAVDGHPLAVGMRVALPRVDDYVAGDDPRAIAGLARLVRGLGPHRPARHTRPVGCRAR